MVETLFQLKTYVLIVTTLVIRTFPVFRAIVKFCSTNRLFSFRTAADSTTPARSGEISMEWRSSVNGAVMGATLFAVTFAKRCTARDVLNETWEQIF